MMAYIMGHDLANMTGPEVEAGFLEMPELYPGWADTQLWLRDVRHGMAYSDAGLQNPFRTHELSFAGTASIVERAADQFGQMQDRECRALKESLLTMEYEDSGRVRVADFYKRALGGEWQFSESLSYLRELGALDESDPARPSVVVTNYVSSPTNCISSSSFYSVCCLDECEGLMGHLERRIEAPEATPEQLAALVAALPSDTVDAPRNLSASLLRRLDEIASSHGGQVPLHGRLFAQWMHHAYPRECPFPHVAGSTLLRSASERAAAMGTNTSASQEVMEMYASTSTDTARAAAA